MNLDDLKATICDIQTEITKLFDKVVEAETKNRFIELNNYLIEKEDIRLVTHDNSVLYITLKADDTTKRIIPSRDIDVTNLYYHVINELKGY